MPCGESFPSESVDGRDAVTGVRVRQVTTAPAMHHHPFYYLPAYDAAMTRLHFVSRRSGQPDIYCELLNDAGRLLRLTDHSDLVEWSIHPSLDGKYVYFADSIGAWRARTDGSGDECLFRFEQFAPASAVGGGGMVGAAMGTMAVSANSRYLAAPLRVAGRPAQMIVLDTHTGRADAVAEAPDIGHPEFHPEDDTLLRYAGSFRQRIWTLNRDGSNQRLAYERNAAAKQWIVHETWSRRPGTREILTADWPKGVLAIDLDTGQTRVAATFNAWHPAVNAAGTRTIADTVFPDIGLQMFDPRPDGMNRTRRTLCHPNATSRGDHWGIGHCPYDDGPIQVYAPQHTHPHPNFSPDGRRVVFTSDRTGTAQVYEAAIPDEWLE